MSKETTLLKALKGSQRIEAIEAKEGNQKGVEFEQEMQKTLLNELEKHRERKFKIDHRKGL